MPFREDPVRYGAENHGIFMIIKAKRRIRLAYDNTLYQLEIASTLKAIYRLDFGSLQRAVGQKVIGGSKWMIFIL